MDEPSSGLPPDAFAPPNQHLHPYTRFHHSHSSHHPQPPPAPVRDARQQPPFVTLDAGLQALDPSDAFSPPFDSSLNPSIYNGDYSLYNTGPEPGRSRALPSHPALARDGDPLKTPDQANLLLQPNSLDGTPFMPADDVPRLRQDQAQDTPGGGLEGSPSAPKQGGHFPGMKMILDPPDLEAWRKVLFEVDKPIELTEEEFQVYFPHVDNVYSHRSTQRYKKQPFVSHYWDCRLKGRPPGTPKSDDPNKRKRKRQARERDLCDVKIKITEYFPSARQFISNPPPGLGPNGEMPGAEPMQVAGLVDNTRPFPGADGARYYQIQRVNGNGGNGKTDGVAGPHKHTLQESDRIKKNSIQRAFAKDAKEKKKAEKIYHRKATGMALATVKKHTKDDPLKLFASWSCPFSQRVWIALELKGVPYQYIEADQSTNGFFVNNAQGVTPLLRHETWDCLDSSVLVQYIDERYPDQHALLLPDIKSRARSRRWAEYVDKELVPSYYRALLEQDPTLQPEYLRYFREVVQKLVDAADTVGPFFDGQHFGYVDAMLAPWIIRLRRAFKLYREWHDPEPGTRWHQWTQGIEATQAVMRTTSSDELYREAYERLMEQRSISTAIAAIDNFTEGKGLP